MLKIPRYNVGSIDREVIRWDQEESGQWCKWEDVQAALEQAVQSVGQKTMKWRFDEEGDIDDEEEK